MARERSALNSRTITEGMGDRQKRFEYNADGTVLYAGEAPRSFASSDNYWIIQKFTYSGGNVTLIQTAFDTWDNRATASYA